MRYQVRERHAGTGGWVFSEWMSVADCHIAASDWAQAHPNPQRRSNVADVLRSDEVVAASYWLEPNGDLMVRQRNRDGRYDLMIAAYAAGTKTI